MTDREARGAVNDREARGAVNDRDARSAVNELCPACGKSHGAVPCPEHATQVALSQSSLLHGAPPPVLAEVPPGELVPGTLVGQYQILHRVGEGGMGVVYAAVHPLIGKKVAVKVLSLAGAGLEHAAQRFLQEARAAAKSQHPNLIQAYDFGQLIDGRPYLVMEFLEGESLSRYLRRRGPLSYRQALPILDGMLAGLKAAHDKGIIHRDLKPENVWICAPSEDAAGGDEADAQPVDPGRIKLLDFGLAKIESGPAGTDTHLTRAGAPMGTPAFMSPEQCRGERDIDHRTDLYSVGVMMWEMFTGRLPFSGSSYVDVMHQHMTATPPSLAELCGMPPDLEQVIRRALAKSPDDRPESAASLRAALHGCAQAADFAPYQAPDAEGDSRGGVTEVANLATVVRAAADAHTLAPPEMDYIDVDLPPPPDTGAFQVEVQLEGDGTLSLTLRGTLEPEDTDALVDYLGALIDVIRARVRRVVLDLRALQYLDVGAMAHLSDWLGVLRDLRDEGLAPTTVRYAESMPNQRLLLPRLERVDPALRLEAID